VTDDRPLGIVAGDAKPEKDIIFLLGALLTMAVVAVLFSGLNSGTADASGGASK
jgi:hypothetical protein